MLSAMHQWRNSWNANRSNPKARAVTNLPTSQQRISTSQSSKQAPRKTTGSACFNLSASARIPPKRAMLPLKIPSSSPSPSPFFPALAMNFWVANPVCKFVAPQASFMFDCKRSTAEFMVVSSAFFIALSCRWQGRWQMIRRVSLYYASIRLCACLQECMLLWTCNNEYSDKANVCNDAIAMPLCVCIACTHTFLPTSKSIQPQESQTSAGTHTQFVIEDGR